MSKQLQVVCVLLLAGIFVVQVIALFAGSIRVQPMTSKASVWSGETFQHGSMGTSGSAGGYAGFNGNSGYDTSGGTGCAYDEFGALPGQSGC